MINSNVLAVSSNLRTSFKQAYPFPHVIIDNFFNEDILNKCLPEIVNYTEWVSDGNNYRAGNQINKFYAPATGTLDELTRMQQNAPWTKYILDYLQSPECISFLEKLTDIKNLIGDDNLISASVHKIIKGGKLRVHADHNTHFTTGLHRRLNILLYLNKEWKDEWDGSLELWNSDLTACTHKIAPLFNRAIIFEVTDNAYHGHPHPLNTPDDIFRLSFAAYYCTKERPDYQITPRHDVLWFDVES